MSLGTADIEKLALVLIESVAKSKFPDIEYTPVDATRFDKTEQCFIPDETASKRVLRIRVKGAKSNAGPLCALLNVLHQLKHDNAIVSMR